MSPFTVKREQEIAELEAEKDCYDECGKSEDPGNASKYHSMAWRDMGISNFHA